ncbi:DUF2845 domain-containing protein [Nitrosomonas sp. Nm58]|jgi:hypothetical protein|uniref:DUF2845 domain-containing protein n=1 Tax=Nitrosomonas sp. Nm58 TaxID=200126 RepID=UPI00089B0C0B|nr:DUF2845 domain-containing protein [Nitrosomonas sp. Nm58]SDY36104.1 Protein of unknown function [Nitrosomonas sp. Nm58]
MKKLLLLLATVICLSGFRAPNGNIISSGDLVDKLLANLGEPQARIHLGTFHYRGNIYITREAWTYKIGQYNHRFIIQNGQIVADDWSRF